MRKIVVFCFTLIFSTAVFAVDLPECGDDVLKNYISEKISETNTNRELLSPVKLRKIRLMEKYVNDFTEVPVKDFAPEDGYLIRDKIIELKINKGYTDDDFKICKSKNESLKKHIYILMYEGKDADNKGEIIFQNVNIDDIL